MKSALLLAILLLPLTVHAQDDYGDCYALVIGKGIKTRGLTVKRRVLRPSEEIKILIAGKKR